MVFGEEARLLMMRILQNFVRDNRGRWDEGAWTQIVERVRRLGFETITDQRMLQLAEDNRERWLAGENGVGPPPVAPAVPPVPTFAPAPAASAPVELGTQEPSAVHAASYSSEAADLGLGASSSDASAGDLSSASVDSGVPASEAVAGEPVTKAAEKKPAKKKAAPKKAKKTKKKAAKKPAKKKAGAKKPKAKAKKKAK